MSWENDSGDARDPGDLLPGSEETDVDGNVDIEISTDSKCAGLRVVCGVRACIKLSQ